MNKLTTPLTFARQCVSTLYLDELTARRAAARRARVAVRDAYFGSRATIRESPLAGFCASIARRRTGSTAPDRNLALPAACMDTSLGSPNYYFALAAITAALEPTQTVEFGTFMGVATTVFALNSPGGAVLTIDLPDDATDVSHLNGVDQSHVRTSRSRVGNCYKGTGQDRQITELKCDSRMLRLRDHVASADLILVDGGHDTSCITADTRNALDIAHPGSVILWDDYFWMYPDVVEFLDGLSKTHDLVRIANTNVVGHIIG